MTSEAPRLRRACDGDIRTGRDRRERPLQSRAALCAARLQIAILSKIEPRRSMPRPTSRADWSTSGCSGHLDLIDIAVLSRAGSLHAGTQVFQSRTISAQNGRKCHLAQSRAHLESPHWHIGLYSRVEGATEMYIPPGLAANGYCERERDRARVNDKFVIKQSPC